MIYVVGALIIKDRRILLAQRSHGELAGKWEFPGGKIETGETEEEALTREIKEELNIDVVVDSKIKSFKHKYPFGEIDLALLKCKFKDKMQNIKLLGSHEKYAWVDYNTSNIELAPLDDKIFAYLKENHDI